MKKNCYFIFAALMFLMAACAQEELPVGGDESKTDISTENADVIYINAVSEFTEDTKASIDGSDGDFKWSTGDKVAVYAAGGYVISEGLAADYNGKTSATFAFAGDQLFGQGDRANFAVFPASLVCDEYGDVYTGDAVTESVLAINLPSVYNLSQVKDNNAPTPMIATNAPGEGLSFKSICALVRFTLHSIPKQTQYITFDFNGKKVRGEFALTDVVPGEETTRAEASATEGFDDVITVYNDNVFTAFQKDLVVNIPIPAGEFSKVTITTWDGDPWDGGHKINGITSSIRTAVAEDGKSYLSWNAGRLSSGKREIYMPVFTVDGNISLGNGTKAVFAPGNLTAEIVTNPTGNAIIGTGNNWSFAENQYDAVNSSIAASERSSLTGKENPNLFLKGSEGKRMDLFAWIGTTATKTDYKAEEKYGIIWPRLNDSGNTSAAYWLGSGKEKIGADWGTLEISGGKDITGYPCPAYPAGTWRLPDYNDKPTNSRGVTEWQRVLTARKYLADYKNNEVIDYCYAKVTLTDGENTVTYGIVIFPDHYDQNQPGTIPAGMPAITKANHQESSVYADNIITLDDWAKLESQGCVFLPAAAYRYKGSPYLTDRIGDGVYWTDYADSGTNAVCMIFSDLSVSESILNATTVNVAKSFSRLFGASVRLIRDIN